MVHTEMKNDREQATERVHWKNAMEKWKDMRVNETTK